MQVDAGEAHRIGVPHDVDERDATGPALHGVHPVAGPGIRRRIRLAAIPDVETVERVIGDGNPDAEQLEKEDQRKVCQKADLTGVSRGPADRRGVRDQNVLEQECADGDYAGQGMKAAQKKRRSLTSPQRSNPTMRNVLTDFLTYPGSRRTG